MPIEITKDTTTDPQISGEILITTIEKNRDRVRTTAGMILSLSGMSLSAALAIALFAVKENKVRPVSLVLICLAAVLFLSASLFAIEASFFRQQYRITTRSQFIADLLQLFSRETRYVRVASVFSIGGLACLVTAVVLQLVVRQ
jgi:hypothetical protein